MRDAPETPGPKRDLNIDESSKLEDAAAKAFLACFAERAPKQPFYSAVVKEAQAFADRLAGK